MKKDIHPQYGPAVVQCACGNVIETRSTKERIQVEICSACHPFFTGRQKLIDTAGRIDRFKKKFGEKINIVSQKKQKKAEKAAKEKAEKAEKVEKVEKAEKTEKAEKENPRKKEA